MSWNQETYQDASGLKEENLDSTDPNKSKQHESIMYPLDNKRSLITPKYQGIKSNTNNINIKPWIVQTPKQNKRLHGIH